MKVFYKGAFYKRRKKKSFIKKFIYKRKYIINQIFPKFIILLIMNSYKNLYRINSNVI